MSTKPVVTAKSKVPIKSKQGVSSLSIYKHRYQVQIDSLLMLAEEYYDVSVIWIVSQAKDKAEWLSEQLVGDYMNINGSKPLDWSNYYKEHALVIDWLDPKVITADILLSILDKKIGVVSTNGGDRLLNINRVIILCELSPHKCYDEDTNKRLARRIEAVLTI